jgi:formiminoglutamase
MPEFTAPDVTIPQTGSEDPRIGSLLARRVAEGVAPRAVIVGFPSDEGVRRNCGRVGAAGAPDRIRRVLYRLTPDAEAAEPFSRLIQETTDLGNLVVTDDVERDQAALGEVLEPHVASGTFVILLGGGHETSYGHFLGYARAERDVRIVNLDAHPDVRPLNSTGAHSGSPFRQALLDPSGRCRGYTVAGLRPQCVAAAHLAFIGEHGGRVIWGRDLDAAAVGRLYEGPGPILATFDIDAVGAADAPGVSAPAPEGLSSATWLAAALAAGRSPAVTSVDLVEVNPTVDVDARTERLAALTIWYVLKGLVGRGER